MAVVLRKGQFIYLGSIILTTPLDVVLLSFQNHQRKDILAPTHVVRHRRQSYFRFVDANWCARCPASTSRG
jgi:hypothetical protein